MERIILHKEDFEVDGQLLRNPDTEKMIVASKKSVYLKDAEAKYCKICFKGNAENAGGYLIINGEYDVPVNSVSVMEIKPPVCMDIAIAVSAESELYIDEISFEELDAYEDLTEQCDEENNVLVITPDYPSSINLYLCAFAHSRNRKYLEAGVHFQVASISVNNWFETVYTIDGIPVFQGTYESLKKLLSTRRYKTIVTHFVEENLYSVFDGYVYPTDQLIFICHGPETTYRFIENITRPYFTRPITKSAHEESFNLRDKFLKKYSQMENVEWVFVSEWLKEFSEKHLCLKFKNSRVISNVINESLFPYQPKKAEDRKKILILRKFDNIMVHSVDQSVKAILELAKRDFFNELTFEVYGDGNYYDVLTEPIKNFDNVHLHRTFIPNDRISEIHKNCGILLIPSRHDTQGVAMGEGASSGLAVVGSRVTCIPFFMNQKKFHTLADPEDPVELADIIERLYRNPDEYLEISRGMSEHIRNLCSTSQTVKREIDLINEKIKLAESSTLQLKKLPAEQPVLSIVVPAYNVEKYLEKCIVSLLNYEESYKTEVIVVNDGSNDRTSEIAKKMAAVSNGIVKVIDKENGGHGSTINAGLKAATGKYFRLIDGDDWVDSGELEKLVSILEKEDADLVLTKGSYAYIEKSLFETIVDYDTLEEGRKYHFEDLIYYGYGFKEHGPLLSTSNYKTELLKKADFRISEKKPYVDMEFNSFSIQYIDTVKFYDLDIYRYLIGREGQTVSKDYWRKKYKDHAFIIFNILNTIAGKDYSRAKREYINRYIISQMVDSQVYMYDAVMAWDELEAFLSRLQKFADAYQASIDYINQKAGNSQLILAMYKKHDRTSSIVIPGVCETIHDAEVLYQNHEVEKTFKWYLKKGMKCVLPYGIVRMITRRRGEG